MRDVLRVPGLARLLALVAVGALLVGACDASLPSLSPGRPTPIRTDRPTPTPAGTGSPSEGPGGSPQATQLPEPVPSAEPAGSEGPGQSIEPGRSTEPGGSEAPASEEPGAGSTPTAEPGESPGPSGTPGPGTSPEPGGPPPSPDPIAATDTPCPKDEASGWTCVTLTVPMDHFHDIGRTWDVTFALKRHTGNSPAKGTFVTATGGPGTSGIWSASSYADFFSAGMRRDYDLVFFDQRGGDQSGGLQCPNAALAWYVDPSDPTTSTPTTGLGKAAKTFVDDCLAESVVDQSTLPYYETAQAAEDLEAFRIWLGVDKLSIYGESYGTQLVQTYALAHPDHVQVLFIDGPVDNTKSDTDFYVEGAFQMDATLEASLTDCSTQRECTADTTGGNEVTAYDQLAAELKTETVPYLYIRKNGTAETRQFTYTDLINAVSGFVSNQSDRMTLQRAMAAASRGDVWWLARMAAISLGQDPDTGKAIPDPSWSDALFYAVECTDYSFPGDTAEDRAQQYLDKGADSGVDATRMSWDYYGDLPCAYWPVQPTRPRPAYLTDTSYPLVVLGATLDPDTPWANAERIYAQNQANSWLFLKPGGPHIIYGRGDACPDRQVSDILTVGRFPAQHRTVCPGDVADDYASVPMHSKDDYASLYHGPGQAATLAAMSDIDDEINYSADYWNWDGVDPLVYGCPFGGTIRYSSAALGYNVSLRDCAFMDGLKLKGLAVINDRHGTFSITAQGGNGLIRYVRDAKGRRSVRGVVAGQG